MRTIPLSCMIGIFVFLMAQNPSVEALSGDITFYEEWAWNYGSCGLEISKQNAFYVAALSYKHMKLPPGMTNPNNHPLCGPTKCIKLNGNRGSIVVKVSDTCDACKDDDVDVADTVFKYLDDPNKGRVRMNWKWVDCQSERPGRVK